MNQEIPNPELQLAFDFVQMTNANIFLTGKAGTGKTTFLRNLKALSPKRMIVVAPTGVAAINAGGVTIHSFFQMHFGPHVPEINTQSGVRNTGNNASAFDKAQRFSREKINIMRSLDLLVIDEISMVRADLLDAVDEVLRRFKDRHKPFGGVQLLMIGDLQQLAPVVKNDELKILQPFYEILFFFGSRALQKTRFIGIELKHIYRQKDEAFINLLNKVRDNKIDKEALEALNKRHFPEFVHTESEGYITLTTHNYQSQSINEAKLNKLKKKAHTFTALLEGDFPEYSYPTDFKLVLKEGAQVMFVKNDISREKLFYNGKIGKITEIDDDTIYVKCEDENSPIPVEPVEWENNKYTIDEQTKEIKETLSGKFTQYPLKLAWAITIHKSQGLTFEKAIIDANAAFAHGQVYVALSRCKTFEGLVLSSPISLNSIKSDQSVAGFSQEIEQNQPGEKELTVSKIAYQHSLIAELFDFETLQKHLNHTQKIIRDNYSVLLPEFAKTFSTLNDFVNTELTGIANKFKSQIGQLLLVNPMVEGHDALQERIKKASTYFAEKINLHVLEILQNIQIETDNKALKKALKESIENLYQETLIKMACFNKSSTGFSVKTHLDVKAKAAIEKPEVKHILKTITSIVSSTGTSHPGLFENLKAWRNATAKDLGVPVYLVLPQKTLYEVVDKMPVSESALLKIKGFGLKKVKSFGVDIIEIILDYCQSNSIGISEKKLPVEIIPAKQIPEKGLTFKTSFDMFQAGKTIPEIARERSLAISTIERHLCGFVRTGQIDVLRLVSFEKYKLISDYLLKNRQSLLSQAIQDLGREISYSEVRFVMESLIFTGLIKPRVL
jgi:nucleoside-triphosphatase THEP1